MFKVFFKKSAEKELERLPEFIIRKVYSLVEALKSDQVIPNTKKLTGYKDLHRTRIGDYRVVYIKDSQIKIVTITKIAHRKDIYRLG